MRYTPSRLSLLYLFFCFCALSVQAPLAAQVITGAGQAGGGAAATGATVHAEATPIAPELGRIVREVWVVDDQGGAGADFIEIQEAVAAASDGDVVLVRDGYYLSFDIAGKSLVVVSEEGPRPYVNYTTVISGLAEGQGVALRGLRLGPTSIALRVSSRNGTVWVSDCRIDGHDTFGLSGPKHGMDVVGSHRVIFDNCDVTSPEVAYGDFAAELDHSTVVAFGTTFHGGFPDLPASPGGAGCIVNGGTLLASGCSFLGGPGGDGGDWGAPDCFPGGRGGAGLFIDQGAGVTLFDCMELGGQGGSAFRSTCPDGETGPGIEQQPGTALTTLSTPARTCDLPRVLDSGGTSTITLHGRPNELARVYLGAGIGALPPASPDSLAVPRKPWTLLATVQLDEDGNAAIPVTLPTVPPQAEALVLVGQAEFVTPQGPVLGSPFVSVVLAPGL